MSENSEETYNTTPIHILMVSKACVTGAYQKKLEELAAFDQIRLTVIVPNQWDGHTLERVYTNGYDLIELSIRLDGNFHLFHLAGLRKTIESLHPDLIHIDEEPYNLVSYQIQKIANTLGIPTVFFSWQNLKRDYPWPFSAFERYVLNHTAYGIAGNSEAVRVWREKGFEGPMEVIPQFGVDPEIFAPASGEAHPRPFTIGYAGRFVTEKGLDLIIRAVAQLKGTWQLMLLGDGPEKEPLRELGGVYNIAGSIQFLEPVPSTEIPGFYHRLDAFVLPSRTQKNWKEQFGRVLIEAMSCGVPVIGSDSGAIPEVIGPAGLIFREDDVDSLQSTLQLLMDQPEVRSTLAEAGRMRVMKHFTQRKIAEDTLEIYEAIRKFS